MDGRPDGELYKQVMIRSSKIYLFRRTLNFVEDEEEEKHIDLFEIKMYDETNDEPFDNFSCSHNWRGLRKRKDVRESSYLSIFFFPFLIFPGSRLRPKTLQAVDVPIIDNRQCERWHKSNGINVVIYDEMMCAGYRGGAKDSCQVYVYSTFFDLLGPTHNAEFNRSFSRLK